MKMSATWTVLFALGLVVLAGGLLLLAGKNSEPAVPRTGNEPGAVIQTPLPTATPDSASSAMAVDEEGATETVTSETEAAGIAGEAAGGAEGFTTSSVEHADVETFQMRQTDPARVIPAALMPAIEEASRKHGVPEQILIGLMAVESGGAHRHGDHSMEGGYGVMNLRENSAVDTLGEAASLVGASKEDVLYNQKLNVEGAAALLARYRQEALAAGSDEAEAWYAALSRYSGRPNPELAAALADEVAGMIMRGFETELSDGGGKVLLLPDPTPPFYPRNWKLAGVTPPPDLAAREEKEENEGSAWPFLFSDEESTPSAAVPFPATTPGTGAEGEGRP